VTAKVNLNRYFRKHRQPVIVAASGLLLAGGWILSYAHDLDQASAVLVILAAVVGGYDVAKKASYTLRSGTVGINILVTLAAIGAIVIGEYWEAGAVVFLFALGNYLEARTMSKTRNALQELLEMTPDTAVVRRNGEDLEVPAREVEPGETVIVKPGTKVPVDGEVTDGESAIDQAPVTGESAPVHKSASDEVYAGTVNQEGHSRSPPRTPARTRRSSGSSAGSRRPRRRKRRRRRSSSASRNTTRPRSSCWRSGRTRVPGAPSCR